MINKKIALLITLLFLFPVFTYAADSNFVTILSGANTVTDSGKTSYSFVGQPVVFDTVESTDYVSKSAFASVFYISQSSSITFTNNTSTENFSDIVVPLNVTIKSSGQNITKVRYRIWEGENADWNDYNKSPELNYEGFTPGTTVEFSTNVAFSQGKTINSFMVYAQLGDDSGSKRWSDAYTVRISSSLSEIIKITSPDPLTKLSSIDPLVETTEYSANLTTAKVTLYKGTTSGSKLYSVIASTYTEPSENKYEIYDTTKGKISFTYSEFAKLYNANLPDGASEIPTTLTQNGTYTLELVSVNGSDTVTFKALSGGVADILTYPSPFNPNKEKIKIRYLLAKDSKVKIRLYDKAGKIVCKLIDNVNQRAGTNEVEWDGRNYAGDILATGAYIVEIIAKASDGGEHRRYTALAIVGK